MTVAVLGYLHLSLFVRKYRRSGNSLREIFCGVKNFDNVNTLRVTVIDVTNMNSVIKFCHYYENIYQRRYPDVGYIVEYVRVYP